jgi:hypothetical protein
MPRPGIFGAAISTPLSNSSLAANSPWQMHNSNGVAEFGRATQPLGSLPLASLAGQGNSINGPYVFVRQTNEALDSETSDSNDSSAPLNKVSRPIWKTSSRNNSEPLAAIMR